MSQVQLKIETWNFLKKYDFQYFEDKQKNKIDPLFEMDRRYDLIEKELMPMK